MRRSTPMLCHPACRLLMLTCVIVSGARQLCGEAAQPSASADWPRWRGSADQGSNDSGTYPVKFDASTGLLWKADLPGKGCSTPIEWKGRIYLTAPVNGQDAAEAFDASTGALLWTSALGAERRGQSNNGSGCNPSPATDGQHLFVYFKSGTLACLDLDGKTVWKSNLQERYGKDTLYWDIGTSPVLTEKDVVIAVMHHGGSYVAAFDKLSGVVHWRVLRDYPTPTEGDHSYATPILLQIDGKPSLLVWGAQHLTCHDPSDGHVIWFCGGFNLKAHNNWVCVASPVVCGDVAVIPYGRGAELHGIKLGGEGDVTSSAHLWELPDKSSFVPTPAADKGFAYVLRDRGDIECVDPGAGKVVWSGKLPKGSASYYASPSIADNKLYAAREDGMLFVAKIDGAFEVLSQNDMGERLIASPVPINNHLLIRGEKHLFCVGTK